MHVLIGVMVIAQLGGPAADDAAQVRAAEERIFEAIRTKDIGALESELAADFVHSPSEGADQDRASFLRAIADMPFQIDELRGEDLRTRILGDIIIVSGRQRARVTLPDGNAVVGVSAFTDVFTRTGEGWRLSHAVSVDLSESAGTTAP